MSSSRKDPSPLDRLLQEIQDHASEEHIPEEVLRAYLGQEEIEEEIEQHLVSCVDCRTLADAILTETSLWEDEPDQLQQLKASTLSRAQAASALPDYSGLLLSALEKIAAVRADLHAALTAWRDRLTTNEMRAGASLMAVLTTDSQNSYLKVLRSLSAPDLDVAPVGPIHRSGVDNQEDPDTGEDLVITDDGWLYAEVRIEEDELIVEFERWPERTAPLVMLFSEDTDAEGRLPSRVVSEEYGMFSVHFEHVPAGSYLLNIASSTAE